MKAVEAIVHLRWGFSQSAAHLPRGFVPSCYSLLLLLFFLFVALSRKITYINFLLVEKPFSVTKSFFFLIFFNGRVLTGVDNS